MSDAKPDAAHSGPALQPLIDLELAQEIDQHPQKFGQFSPLDFSDANTILHFGWGGYLFHSPDRGVTWKGPFQLPLFDMVSWQLRTDYLVEDRNTVLAFWSGSKVALKRNENGGMVHMVNTADGGLTWTKEALVSRVVEPSEQRHDVALMPATVRVSRTKLVCCTRNLTAYPKVGWIDCRMSTDNGRRGNSSSSRWATKQGRRRRP